MLLLLLFLWLLLIPETYLKSLVKIGSVTAEILLLFFIVVVVDIVVLVHVVAVDPRNLSLKFFQNWISNT